MRYRFISERCKILGLLLLLAAGSAVLRAQDQPGIKNIRTVVYEPLLKDTTWVSVLQFDEVRVHEDHLVGPRRGAGVETLAHHLRVAPRASAVLVNLISSPSTITL